MKTKEASKSTGIFKFILGGMAGFIIATIPSILAKDIPNPLVLWWEQSSLKRHLEKDSVVILLDDGRTPLKGAVVKAVCPDTSGDPASFYFGSVFKNQAWWKTGNLEFQYYLGATLPKPVAASPSDHPGYAYRQTGAITWRPNEADAVKGFKLPLGTRFGGKYGGLPPGKHDVMLRIVNDRDSVLYEGAFTLEITDQHVSAVGQ